MRQVSKLTFVAACALAASQAFAQPQRDVDFDAVEVSVHSISGNIYYLEGSGGNIGLSIGEDGIVMVDAQFAPLTEKVVAAIRTMSDAPIRFLINTHVHDDHTGGNENFGAMGTTILARANVRVRMMQGIRGSTPWPTIALPVITFTDAVSLHLNGEDIHVIPVPPAHTDGDSYVYFTGSDVLHMGDVFRTNGYPGIDGENGGTLQGTLDALQIAIDLAGPNTKILSGHGVVSTREDVRAFRDMILEVMGRVSRLVEEGKTLEEVIAANPTADLDAQWGPRLDRFMPALYDGLSARP
jgi:glyoxylase-like metal-dependent hydrolase (beta-lactamase superfamily II)